MTQPKLTFTQHDLLCQLAEDRHLQIPFEMERYKNVLQVKTDQGVRNPIYQVAKLMGLAPQGRFWDILHLVQSEAYRRGYHHAAPTYFADPANENPKHMNFYLRPDPNYVDDIDQKMCDEVRRSEGG